MSITDELREYSKTATASPAVFKELTDIADRIDKRHAKARDKAYDDGVCDGIDADKNAMGYIKLPVDADGVPIHIGDELCGYGRPNGGVFCKAVNERMVLVGEKDDGYKMWLLWDGSECHHYHAPTVEDVLREFAEKMVENTAMYVAESWDADERDEADAAAIAEYAAKLRLAGESE